MIHGLVRGYGLSGPGRAPAPRALGDPQETSLTNPNARAAGFGAVVGIVLGAPLGLGVGLLATRTARGAAAGAGIGALAGAVLSGATFATHEIRLVA